MQRRDLPPPTLPRWHPVALAACLCLASAAALAQSLVPDSDDLGIPPPTESALRRTYALPAPAARTHDGKEPIFFEADHLEGETASRTRATGSVRVRQGGLLMRADELTHTQTDNTASALGNVRISRDGNLFYGPALTINLDTLEGNFVRPRFWLARTQAGGTAELVEFLGEDRVRARRTTYSSCTPENTADGTPGRPDWQLRTSEVFLDFAANEGVARNAVVEFFGVPILAAPVLSFPLNDERKSGLLPPSFVFDSRSGFEFSVPYYWNIAPDKDATIAPIISTKRGAGLNLEFRYLAPSDEGEIELFGMPKDRLYGGARGHVDFRHKGEVISGGSLRPTLYEVQLQRVSDDDYWKDLSQHLPSKQPRLYDSHIKIERTLNDRNWGLGDSQTVVYGSVQQWQTLLDRDPTADESSAIISPYQREPQLGVRSRGNPDNGLIWQLQGEFNRFTNEDRTLVSGNRVHATAQVERPFDISGVHINPRAILQSTSYDLDSQNLTPGGKRQFNRTVPTVSVDASFSLERPVALFGGSQIQTLEPRLQYVRTPYRDQAHLPMFDSAARDFSQYAVFSENAFTGSDRISDANQVTLGATSRLIDATTGVETLRVGAAQRVLLQDQRINPNGDEPITDRLSDLMLWGGTSVIPNWNFDGTMQIGAETRKTQQATLGVRYSPGDYRTISATYRYTREASAQWDIGWQWPLSGRTPTVRTMMNEASSPDLLNITQAAPGGSDCRGSWYTVGRVSYSARDKRIISTLAGVEYDAGCWIGRFVVDRVALGQKATTRLMFQLELIGLSRLSLGANPLRALSDNIPGYRLLREDGPLPAAAPPSQSFSDD